MTAPYPCLWFDNNAEEAANLYTSLLPDSRIEKISRSASDNPSVSEGDVLTVEFTVAGQHFLGLNGGPLFSFTPAVSFVINVEDQGEVDRLWAALTADGGEESQCGWLKDRFGLSWQIIPQRLGELLQDPDPDRARRAMQAMLAMTKIDVAALERAADG